MGNKFQAVIFDLDGTLIDSIEDIANSVNAILGKRGFPEHAPDRYRWFIGDGLSMTLRRALPEEYRNKGVMDECLHDLHDHYRRNLNRKTRLYGGISELLNGLSSRNIPMAVLSNKADEFTKNCVEELLGDWNFRAAIGQRDGVAAKPDPAGALEIAALVGIPCDRFAYLGDTRVDMETAIGAGMYPVGALWGFRPEEELKQAGARMVIDSPADLLSLF